MSADRTPAARQHRREQPEDDGFDYELTFVAYCGMTIPLGASLTRGEAQGAVERRVRQYRRWGFDVDNIGPGRWEFNDENCGITGDDQGVLHVRRRWRR